MREMVESEASIFKKMSDDLWTELMALEGRGAIGVGYSTLIHDDDASLLDKNVLIRTKRFDTFLDRLERKSYKGRAKHGSKSAHKRYGTHTNETRNGYNSLSTISLEKQMVKRRKPLTVKRRTTTVVTPAVSYETTTTTITTKVKSTIAPNTIRDSTLILQNVQEQREIKPLFVDEKVYATVYNTHKKRSGNDRSKIRISKMVINPEQQQQQQGALCSLRGAKGAPGKNGAPGIPGRPGDNGKPGRNGANNDAEASGECRRCPEGAPGVAGPTGPPGIKGARGPNGMPGAMMNQLKLKGPPGPPGDIGEPGENGIEGMAGRSGENGVRFRKGPPGEKGLAGIAGDAGEPGERGADGVPGKAGEPGPVGLRGAPGRNGMPGPPGDNGSPGSPGTDRSYCKCPVRSVFLMALRRKDVNVDDYLTHFKKRRESPLLNDADYLAVYKQYGALPYYRVL